MSKQQEGYPSSGVAPEGAAPHLVTLRAQPKELALHELQRLDPIGS